EARRGRVEVELGAPGVAEGVDRLPDGLLRAQGGVGDPVGERAGEGVVVPQVAAGLVLDLRAEGVVGERGQARLALASGLGPGGADRREELPGLLRPGPAD